MIKILIFLTLFETILSQSVPGACFCVPTGTCNNNGGNGGNNGGNDGSGNIDIRIQTNGQTSGNSGTNLQLTSPASSGIQLVVASQFGCQNGLDRCCPPAGYQCGMRFNPVSNARSPPIGSGQTYYGQHPWLAVILQQSDQSFQAAGVLIDHLHVMTAAHKLNQTLVNGQQLVVQIGRWDGISEIYPPQVFSVIRTIVHPQFSSSSLRNDIALLRLSSSVFLGQVPTVGIACLPTSPVTNVRCWVAGYGSGSMGGLVQTNLQKEVDLPLVDANTCQNQLRATRLGSNFILDGSFICAGGEGGKDACTGDGGAPLVCQIANQWYVVGITAWGIGCGTFNVPGVYVDVSDFIPWIQQSTRS